MVRQSHNRNVNDTSVPGTSVSTPTYHSKQNAKRERIIPESGILAGGDRLEDQEDF